MKRNNNEFKTFKVKKIFKENYRVTTLILDGKIDAKAGQFLMVWIPNVDEKPFGIANNNPLTLSIANVGPFSSKITSLKEGEDFSFKGPLGKEFTYNNENKVLIVGGGYGVVPLYFLAKEIRDKNKSVKITVIIGAKTERDLIYKKRFEEFDCEVLLSTNDGSVGTKGFVTDVLKNIELDYQKVYSCGPAPMMRVLGKLLDDKKINYEFSLESYMKCGIGICGSCAVGDKLVCKDGPVFNREELKNMPY